MRLAASILIVFMIGIGFAAAAPKQVVLQQDQALISTFKQERYLKGFDGPIISKGRFILLANRAVVWSTKHPVKSRMIVDKKGISQTVLGRKTLRLSVSKLPGVAALQSIFEATLNGNWRQVERQFGSKLVYKGNRWSFSFQPKQKRQAAVIKKITLSGRGYAEVIEIQRMNGDRDKIYLSEHSVVNSATLPELNGRAGYFK